MKEFSFPKKRGEREREQSRTEQKKETYNTSYKEKK